MVTATANLFLRTNTPLKQSTARILVAKMMRADLLTPKEMEPVLDQTRSWVSDIPLLCPTLCLIQRNQVQESTKYVVLETPTPSRGGQFNTSSSTPPTRNSRMLIPPPLVPGPTLSMDTFCTTYELDEDICNRFKEHKFRRTHAFKYTEVAELKEMGFMAGEIAELRAAIGAWAQVSVVA